MIGRPPGAVHPTDGEESAVSVRYKLPMARRSIALLSLLAGLHVAGCTHEVHTAPTNLHDAVVLGLSPEAAWKVLEGGRSVGSVVLYREDSSPNREFYAVHNVHEQDMGQIDSNGRAWRSDLVVIANAGGLNPHGCADACIARLRDAGLTRLRVGVVTGDDLMPSMDRLIDAGETLVNLETDEPIDDVRDRLVTANAYLGAEPIVEALHQGANLIITGRVAVRVVVSLVTVVCIDNALNERMSNDVTRIEEGERNTGHAVKHADDLTQAGSLIAWQVDLRDVKIGRKVVRHHLGLLRGSRGGGGGRRLLGSGGSGGRRRAALGARALLSALVRRRGYRRRRRRRRCG